MNPHSPIAAFALVAALALPGYAQEANQGAVEAVAAPSLDLADELYAYVELVDAEFGVRNVLYADFGQNGEPAAVIVLDNCDDLGCEWQMVARKENGYEPVGGAFAKEVRVEDVSGAPIVWSDGVTWGYSGDALYILGGLLEGRVAFDASPKDVAPLNEAIPDLNLDAKDAIFYELELTTKNPGNERVYMLFGPAGNYGESGNRFFVTSNDGEVLVDAKSVDAPSIFRKPDEAGSTLVTFSAGQMAMIDLE